MNTANQQCTHIVAIYSKGAWRAATGPLPRTFACSIRDELRWSHGDDNVSTFSVSVAAQHGM